MNKSSKKFVFKLIGLQIMATALLLGPLNAMAQRRGGGGSSSGHHAGTNVDPNFNSEGIEKKVAIIQEYKYQGDLIPVLKKLQLKQELQSGKKLVSLSVKAQATQHGSKLVVLLNNQKIDAISLSGQMQKQQIMIPSYGQINKLQLKVKGGAFVGKLIAKLALPAPKAELIKARVNIQTMPGEMLKIKQLIKQQNYGVNLKDKKIKKVIIKVSSMMRGGGRHGRNGRNGRYGRQRTKQAILFINGSMVSSQQVFQGEQRIVFQVPQYLQNSARTVQIKITGRASVKMVGLKVQSKNRYNY